MVKDPLGKELVGLKGYVFDRWVMLGATRTLWSDFLELVLVGSFLRALTETMDEGLRGRVRGKLFTTCFHHVTTSFVGINIHLEPICTSLALFTYLSSIKTWMQMRY